MPYDPVMDMQVGLDNGAGQQVRSGQSVRRAFGAAGAVAGDVVDATPRYVAGIIVGSVVVLAALRITGFRFSFGAAVGGKG